MRYTEEALKKFQQVIDSLAWSDGADIPHLLMQTYVLMDKAYTSREDHEPLDELDDKIMNLEEKLGLA